MISILQISDLHFGTPFLPHVGEALLHAADELQPDLIVVSGDLTQRATEEEFRSAREWLARLPSSPSVLAPGNHDVPQLPRPTQLFVPFARYRRHIQEQLDHVVDHPGVRVVSLNSVSWFGSWFNGKLAPRQLQLCSEAFEGLSEDTLKVVVAHHHLAPAPSLDRHSVMSRAGRAIEHLSRLRVDLVLGGHQHRAYVGNSLDFYAGGGRDHGIVIVQCGTSTSRRGRGPEREKNTFNLIRAEDDQIHVVHYVYYVESDGFEVMSEHAFARPGSGRAGSGGPIQALPRRAGARDGR